MPEYEDRYGDTLTVTVSDYTVEIEANEGSIIASLEFDNADAATIARKILEEVGEPTKSAAPITPASLFSGNSGNERFEWNRVAAIAASKLGLGVEFKYTKSDTAPVELRSLTRVSDVVETADGNWIVLGHSDERDDERSFRIDRMVSFISVNG